MHPLVRPLLRSQADAESKLATCEKQLLGCKERITGLSAELEAERARAAKVGAGSLPATRSIVIRQS